MVMHRVKLSYLEQRLRHPYLLNSLPYEAGQQQYLCLYLHPPVLCQNCAKLEKFVALQDQDQAQAQELARFILPDYATPCRMECQTLSN